VDSNQLRPMRTVDDLELAIARSSLVPVLLFKHSQTCGLSAQAHEEVTDFQREHPSAVEVHVVRIREHRDLSDAIAARFGVRHESPQVLLVHEGRLVWHASHFRVTAAEILAACRRVAGASAAGAASSADREA